MKVLSVYCDKPLITTVECDVTNSMPNTCTCNFHFLASGKMNCVCLGLSEPVCAVGQGVSALCCATEEQKWIFSGYSLTGVSVRIQQMSYQKDIMNIFSHCIESLFTSFSFLKALCVWAGALPRFCQPSPDCGRLCERQRRLLHRWVFKIFFAETSSVLRLYVHQTCLELLQSWLVNDVKNSKKEIILYTNRELMLMYVAASQEDALHVVLDRHLVTGQNVQSTTAAVNNLILLFNSRWNHHLLRCTEVLTNEPGILWGGGMQRDQSLWYSCFWKQFVLIHALKLI